jgi:biotin carboxyl carrier protein
LPESGSPTPTVSVAEVAAGSIRSTVTLQGVVVRENTQNVPAPISGTLTQLSVRPGDAVAAGDNLATVTLSLNPSPSPSSTFNGQSPSPSPSFSPITESVDAPIAGTVGKLTAAKGQFVVSGQTLLTVIPLPASRPATPPGGAAARPEPPMPATVVAAAPGRQGERGEPGQAGAGACDRRGRPSGRYRLNTNTKNTADAGVAQRDQEDVPLPSSRTRSELMAEHRRRTRRPHVGCPAVPRGCKQQSQDATAEEHRAPARDHERGQREGNQRGGELAEPM